MYINILNINSLKYPCAVLAFFCSSKVRCWYTVINIRPATFYKRQIAENFPKNVKSKFLTLLQLHLVRFNIIKWSHSWPSIFKTNTQSYSKQHKAEDLHWSPLTDGSSHLNPAGKEVMQTENTIFRLEAHLYILARFVPAAAHATALHHVLTVLPCMMSL